MALVSNGRESSEGLQQRHHPRKVQMEPGTVPFDFDATPTGVDCPCGKEYVCRSKYGNSRSKEWAYKLNPYALTTVPIAGSQKQTTADGLNAKGGSSITRPS